MNERARGFGSDPEASAIRLLRALDVEWPGAVPRPTSAVVGVDGSPESHDAVRWAAAIASEVHLVGAADAYRMVASPFIAFPTDGGVRAVEAAVRRLLDDATSLVGDRAYTTTLSLASPVAALQVRADETQADLIVVGHTRKGPTARLFVGSTAQALAHHARQSVLVARGAPRAGAVVAGIDDAPSAYAASWAIGIARWLGGTVTLAYASTEAGDVRYDGTAPPFVTIAGPARKSLPALAAAADSPLLVVGHGRRPSWLGSDAMSIVRHAECSVMVARKWQTTTMPAAHRATG